MTTIASLLKSRPDLAARVLRMAEPTPVSTVTSPADILAILAPIMDGRETEAFVCIAIDNKLRAIGVEVLATGSDVSCVVCTRQVLRWALTRPRGAARMIVVAHNHPSGDPEPSQEDMRVTRAIKAACEVVGIPLMDHVVVGEEGAYVSFAARGML